MKINGSDGVDAGLRRLGTLVRRQERVEHVRDDLLSKVRERVGRLLKPIKGEFKRLKTQLERWTLTHQGELQERTLRLTHGAVRLQKTPDAIVSDLTDDEIVERLEKRGLFDCVRPKKEPNLVAMKSLDDATLAKVGCRRESHDEFKWQLPGETEWR